MSVWNKLLTAVKGHANNAAEALEDANLMTILDQEMREANDAISKAKDEKAKIAGNRHMKEKKVRELEEEIERRLSSAKKAKEQQNVGLATEIVESVVKLQAQLKSERELFEQYSTVEKRMDASIQQSKSKVETLKRKIEGAKANEAMINAQKAASSNSGASNSRLASAVDSLERLETRQAQTQAMMDAADDADYLESGADLDAKIAALEDPKAHDVNSILDNL